MDEINWVRCREPVEFNEWMNDVRSVKRMNLNEKITPSLSESSTLRDNNNIAELPCTCMLRNATMNVTCTSPASICPSFKSSTLTETGATNVLFHFIHPSISGFLLPLIVSSSWSSREKLESYLGPYLVSSGANR